MIVLEVTGGFARRTAVDEGGCTWMTFEVVYLTEQEDGECQECGDTISEGWMNLDMAGDEVCYACAVEKASHLTFKQHSALHAICERFKVPFDAGHYKAVFDLPAKWVAGWVGGPHQQEVKRTIYIGCGPDGDIHS